jgi:hypothetical protein
MRRGKKTYHSGIDKRRPALSILEERKDETDGRTTQQYYDELVLELLEDQFPYGRRRVLR